MANPLLEVQKFGQSIWFDNLRRGLITSGELQAMVERDGLLGVTSNPAIFALAITGSSDYDQALKALVAQGVGTAQDLYERLAIEDVQLAADILYPVYARTAGRDGFVSLEVSPHLADDTKGTVEEARRLHAAVRRDNVLIKVPATAAGLPAVRQLVSEGISVNVTLLFAVETYEAAARAYLAGLEAYHAKGGEVNKVAGVASFFLSRIDTLVDARLEKMLDATTDPARRRKLKSLIGKVAIANARLAYARYKELIASDRWKALAARKALPQRLLWASTGTKNPKYPKTLYVDELIGPDTVNTVPAETFKAFREHGRARPSLTENWAESLDHAREVLNNLAEVGIPFKDVTDTLLREGIRKFAEPFDALLAAVEKKRQALVGKTMDAQTYAAGEEDEGAVAQTLDDWRVGGKVRRLWNGDATLWTGTDEGRWLGWLHLADGQLDHPDHFRDVADDVREAGFRHALVLGMGGSSLFPEVLARTFGRAEGFPELLVLDSTVPAQVRAVERKIDPARTLFIVSSKSGGTAETDVLRRYFLDRARQALGDRAGAHFVAITDPKTRLQAAAKNDRFRHIFYGVPSVGGRFSALSNFGMVPAAVLGLDVPRFLSRAEVMVHSCASCVPPELNPGVVLGAVLGTLSGRGREKVTLVLSPAVASLGAWLEQLLAESTGKDGTGLVPVDGERLGPPEVYGDDRLFVYVRLAAAPSAEQDAAVAALGAAGHPVVRVAVEEPADLGQEVFRWEVATAVAGSVLGVNAFNQPDVEAAKVAARTLTAAYEASGKLPAEKPLLTGDGLTLFADPRNAEALATAARGKTAEALLAAHLGRLRPGDYFAVNAFVAMNEANDRELQAVRLAVRDSRRVATTLGYGPRFLHSTGQLHKGGPATGVFLQVTADDAEDLPIPGQKYTFGALKQAQALGDFQVLAERGRRLLRVHLGADVAGGLARLRDLVRRATGP
jgi:transaldolase/glucose-6-phosphate isomerase